MNRVFAFLLCLLTVCLLASCGSAGSTEQTTNPANPQQTAFIKPSTGLEYAINEDGETCSVIGMGECTDTWIWIPDAVSMNLYSSDLYPVTGIADSAFYCKEEIQGIRMGAFTTSVGGYAFYGCHALQVVELGEQMLSLGAYSFGSTAIREITIPASMESISAWAFYECKSLLQVHIQDLEAWFGISFGGAYANPMMLAQALYLDGEVVTKVVVPESVTVILPWTFAGCESLTEVHLHENVTEIGQRAFLDCENLTRLVYDGTHAQWKLMVLGTYWDFSVEEFVIVCQDKQIKG